MIKVPFDTDGGGGYDYDHANRSQLNDTLDNAYKTMEWFRYLADKAERVEVVETYQNAEKFTTTTVVGFELEPKHETFYRLKYQDT